MIIIFGSFKNYFLNYKNGEGRRERGRMILNIDYYNC